ncbi:hypothetical protein KO500_14890, partial [Cellulophaga baltica]|nr:hypothetical protein [Cellulophaga baltica]MDO6769129.1 hypothetical protein [Cellulophaga sp. 1_MG-2023]
SSSSSNSLINKSNSVIIKSSSNKLVFETDDIKNDPRIKNLDPNTIKSMKIDKNKTGNGGTIEIELIDNHEEVTSTSTFISGEKPITVINGKVQNKDFDMNTISPDKIESVNILKEEKATIKYGEKGKNGAIEITLKK